LVQPALHLWLAMLQNYAFDDATKQQQDTFRQQQSSLFGGAWKFHLAQNVDEDYRCILFEIMRACLLVRPAQFFKLHFQTPVCAVLPAAFAGMLTPPSSPSSSSSSSLPAPSVRTIDMGCRGIAAFVQCEPSQFPDAALVGPVLRCVASALVDYARFKAQLQQAAHNVRQQQLQQSNDQKQLMSMPWIRFVPPTQRSRYGELSARALCLHLLAARVVASACIDEQAGKRIAAWLASLQGGKQQRAAVSAAMLGAWLDADCWPRMSARRQRLVLVASVLWCNAQQDDAARRWLPELAKRIIGFQQQRASKQALQLSAKLKQQYLAAVQSVTKKSTPLLCGKLRAVSFALSDGVMRVHTARLLSRQQSLMAALDTIVQTAVRQAAELDDAPHFEEER
jgi:hypothetical protein